MARSAAWTGKGSRATSNTATPAHHIARHGAATLKPVREPFETQGYRQCVERDGHRGGLDAIEKQGGEAERVANRKARRDERQPQHGRAADQGQHRKNEPGAIDRGPHQLDNRSRNNGHPDHADGRYVERCLGHLLPFIGISGMQFQGHLPNAGNVRNDLGRTSIVDTKGAEQSRLESRCELLSGPPTTLVSSSGTNG